MFLLFGIRRAKVKVVQKNKNIVESMQSFLNMCGLNKDVYLQDLFEKNKQLVSCGSYLGYRNFRGLPVKNQRTKTNARTSRRV